MKRKVIIVFTLILFLICASSSVFAANSFDASLIKDKQSIKPGEEFSVQFEISNINVGEEGINVIEGTLDYNKDVFESITASNIKTTENWELTYNTSNGKFLAINYSNGTKDDFLLLTIKIKAKETVKEAKEENITISDITSNDGVDLINIGTKSANIKVAPKIDENGTKEINVEDNTTAKGIIPQTGGNIIPIIIIIAIVIIALIIYIKYKKLSKILVLLIPVVAMSTIMIPVKASVLDTKYYSVSDNIISRVEPKTTVADFKYRFYVENGKELKVYSGSREITEGIIHTGMNTQYDGEEYKISVTGDIDGDGNASQEELTLTIRHILDFKDAELKGLPLISADITGDNIVDQRDITKYIKFIINQEYDLGKEDTTPPVITLRATDKTTKSITAEVSALDREDGMNEETVFTFFIKEKNSGEFEEIQSSTNTTCTFSNLKDNTTYVIKVTAQDKAGNEGQVSIEETTGAMPEAQGNIELGQLTWSNGKATIQVNTETDKIIEYQINGTNGEWIRGTTINNLNDGDTVYIRLTDGKNAGEYIQTQIKDSTNPDVDLQLEIDTQKITATATASDDESGIAEDTKYKFSIKDEDDPNGEYVEKQNTTSNVCEFTNLPEGRNYAVKVEVTDRAGNVTTVVGRIKVIDDVPPILTANIEEETTNSITITTQATDGVEMPDVITYTYYIKKSSQEDSEYYCLGDFTENEITINNLEQNTEYVIKIKTSDKIGNETAITKVGTTKSVPAGDITIDSMIYNNSTGKMKVKIHSETEGYTLQYSTNGTDWTEIESGDYTAEQTSNTTVYARLWDGVNGSTTQTEYKILFNSIATVAQPGDYIRFTPGNNSVTLQPSQTGYSIRQIINSSTYEGLWQVLYNDNTNGFQIISAYLTTDVYLGGKDGYNNSVSTLNEISKLYENPDYTVENSGRSVGTNPVNPSSDTTETFELSFDYEGSSNSQMKIEDSIYETDFTAMQNAISQSPNGIANVGDYYWLPNRRIYSDNGMANFNLYTISSEGTIKYRKMKSIYKYGNEFEYDYPNGVRPVLKFLNSVVEIDGDGTYNNPYILPNVL